MLNREEAAIMEALREFNMLVNIDNIFREAKPNVIMPPMRGQKRPNEVSEKVPAACVLVPTGYLFKILRDGGAASDHLVDSLNNCFNRQLEFTAGERLAKMGVPKIKDAPELNCMLAFDDGGFCETGGVDCEKFDISGCPAVWLWHDGGGFHAGLDWEGVLGWLPLMVGKTDSPSILAARIYYSFLLLTPDLRVLPNFRAMMEATAFFGAALDEAGLPWFGMGSADYGENGYLVYMPVPPGKLAGYFLGRGREWLEMCDMIRQAAWSLAGFVMDDPKSWIEKIAAKGQSAILEFLDLACKDFFSACFEFMKPGGMDIMPYIAAVRMGEKFKNEGLGFTGEFCLGLYRKVADGKLHTTIGVYSGLPFFERIAPFDGFTFCRGDFRMEMAKTCVSAPEDHADALAACLEKFLSSLRDYEIPAPFEKVVDMFYSGLAKSELEIIKYRGSGLL